MQTVRLTSEGDVVKLTPMTTESPGFEFRESAALTCERVIDSLASAVRKAPERSEAE